VPAKKTKLSGINRTPRIRETAREIGGDNDRASFGRAFEQVVRGLGAEKEIGGKMKRVAPLLAALALAGCVPHPEPEYPLHHGYSDEELAKLPVAQRCSYLSSLFSSYLTNQKTTETWKSMMQKWGCEPTFRVWKPAS
jgi:hypothetical protein